MTETHRVSMTAIDHVISSHEVQQKSQFKSFTHVKDMVSQIQSVSVDETTLSLRPYAMTQVQPPDRPLLVKDTEPLIETEEAYQTYKASLLKENEHKALGNDNENDQPPVKRRRIQESD